MSKESAQVRKEIPGVVETRSSKISLSPKCFTTIADFELFSADAYVVLNRTARAPKCHC